jgi:small-conductance mechanosensitive channel
VGVSCECDPDRVLRVLEDVARQAAAEMPDVLTEPAPWVMFDPGFGDWSFGFSVGVQVAEFSKQYVVRSELRLRIFRRLRAEGISIPYPTRTLHIESGPAADKMK